jgi:hypothetical protein
MGDSTLKLPIHYVQQIRSLIRDCRDATGVQITHIDTSWMGRTLIDVEVTSRVGDPDDTSD